MKKRHILRIFIFIFLFFLVLGTVRNWSVLQEELLDRMPFLENYVETIAELTGLNPEQEDGDFASEQEDGDFTSEQEDRDFAPEEQENDLTIQDFEPDMTAVFWPNGYYYDQLDDTGKAAYEQILQAVQKREESVQVYLTDDSQLDQIYHGLLKDHPELFWIHNRKEVYKTTYQYRDDCLFTPSYLYTEQETKEIRQAMERAYQEVRQLIPAGADTYEIVKTVYIYLIDETDYAESEDDQNIAGVFWKKQAVCAGYAAAVQYLLGRLQIPCIYVDGTVTGRSDGHAWDLVQIDGAWYYVDATNGDQPEFLQGDFVQLAEHKTIVMDYLCPFPWEYEVNYHASTEFSLPACTATDKNFFVINQGIFYGYDWQSVYDYCCMRINNNAAVVRFKFNDQEAFDQAVDEWINGSGIQEVAQYYMRRNGLNRVEYHYGVLEDLKTVYFIF